MASRARILAMLKHNATYADASGSRDGVGGAYIGGCEGCGMACMHCGGTVIGGRKRKMTGAAYIGGRKKKVNLVGSAYIGGRKRKMKGGLNEGLSNYVMWRAQYLRDYEATHGVVPSKAHVSKAWKEHKKA